MSRCLSERTLLRLLAGSGREAQRTHLAACRRCGVRYRTILRDLDRVTDVLFHTAPPRWSPSRLTRHWLPASASAVAALAVVLIWVENTVWRAGAPAHQEEVTAFVSDVSSVMFSMHDAPTDDTGNATADYDLATDCSSDPLRILGCESDNESGQTR